MKPRTKEQEQIVKWSNELHSQPTTKQAAYARRHCFEEVALESRGTCLCTACKHTWRVKDTSANKQKCPHCGRELKVKPNRRQITEKTYFTVLTTKANMQVVVWYLVTRTIGRDKNVLRFAHVGSEWIRQDGKCFSVELPRFTMCWEKDRWITGAALELRRNSIFSRLLSSSASFYSRVLPLARRNGWKPNHDFDGYDTGVISNLLANKSFESWYKIGHYGMCWRWLCLECNYRNGDTTKPVVSDGEQTLIKLANRKHVVFDTTDKLNDYLDYLKDLEYMNQDIHNPRILFPDDFQSAHQALSERARKRRHREAVVAQRQHNIELMERKAKKDLQTKMWINKYTQGFGDMHLTSGDFTILPLVSMDDFECEAAHMHHCIATYYGKLDTLLLSIEHNGKKCETAEINLLGAGRIIQCRGVNNQPSDYHDDIVHILKGFMEEFVKRFNKPVIQSTLPVPMSFYRQFQIAI